MASNNEDNSSGNSNIKTTFITAADVNKKVTGTSAFSKAFSGIKDSEFYNEPPPEVIAAAEKGALSGPAAKPSQNCVIVNSRQRGNPILKAIRNVPWEYGEIVPDYTMGVTTCALFLSLRYFNLNPNYVHDRLKQLGNQYELRILLVQVDVKDPHHELKQLSKICILADMTLMLAWSADEAGRIIEIYKMFEHKPPDLIMEKQESNPYSMLIDALTSIKSVNRTDAMTLLSNFGSLERIIGATQDELAVCPGLGPQKAQRLYTVLHQQVKRYASPKKKVQPIKSIVPVTRFEDKFGASSSGSSLPSSSSTNNNDKDNDNSTSNLENA